MPAERWSRRSAPHPPRSTTAHRPAAREAVAQVARYPVAPSRIIQLAATLSVT
ncbi:hypothetical protein OG777_25400 [Micromonospora peucetia]|uniref:Uncharacterized protein n=1 Tax=Micromonospora peucetia TaxID=47871 RepID=A0ABZ1EFA8_9ACTN|nr:hypothetical protein [Micromonospora peucetia]MCX4390233.1 hypothetical protein [Micromonospora peucetia]WSA32458.1 hypothetical protein OIE14_30920 [Micromonospora peucetia]